MEPDSFAKPIKHIDAHIGSRKGHYVNLGMSAIEFDGMAQRVCAGKAATRYPRWAARAGEYQSLKTAPEFILLRAPQTDARDLRPGKPAHRGSLRAPPQLHLRPGGRR